MLSFMFLEIEIIVGYIDFLVEISFCTFISYLTECLRYNFIAKKKIFFNRSAYISIVQTIPKNKASFSDFMSL